MTDHNATTPNDEGPFLYSVGDLWTQPIPPGDTFGLYWQDGGGLFLLGAVQNMRERERNAFAEGKIRAYFGLTKGRQLIGVFDVDEFGQIDAVIGNVTSEDFTPDVGAYNALRWVHGGGHGTVTAIFVDRVPVYDVVSPQPHVVTATPGVETVDTIAALRFFTLSPHVTQYVGRELHRLYTGPIFSQADYISDVLTFHADYPTVKDWMRNAVVSCKAGA